MKSDTLNEYLKQLEQISKVDPSPFLYTRIEQKIKNELNKRAPIKVVWSMAASFCILLILNFYSIRHANSPSDNQKNVAEVFQLMPDNNFYK